MCNSFANIVQGKNDVSSSTDPQIDVDAVCTPINNTSMLKNDKKLNDTTSDHSLYNMTFVDHNTHPLYLHNNVQPGLVLITKKLSGLDNFGL